MRPHHSDRLWYVLQVLTFDLLDMQRRKKIRIRTLEKYSCSRICIQDGATGRVPLERILLERSFIAWSQNQNVEILEILNILHPEFISPVPKI